MFLCIADSDSIPDDIDKRMDASKIILCVADLGCVGDAVLFKLSNLAAQGCCVLFDNVTAATLTLREPSSFSIDCSTGGPLFVNSVLSTQIGGVYLAKHIFNRLHLKQATEAGSVLFSGDYAFSQAENNRTSDTTKRLLKLFSLNAHDTELRELEDLFKQDKNHDVHVV